MANRKIDDKTYLNYLLQSLNVKELKEICKSVNLKGYSRLKKNELIDFITNSLDENEISTLIQEQEKDIISNEIEVALKKIKGIERENLSYIKILNEKNHEIELVFKGFNWKTVSYLSITDSNIDDPERDCDCRIGGNLGFCNHFWAGFLFSAKNGFFKLKNWTLTSLPEDIDDIINNIEIKTKTIEENGKEITVYTIRLIKIDDPLASLNGQSVTVYESEITKIQQREYEFEGNIVSYYLLSLKNVKIGPKIARKSEFREENVIKVNELKVRLSEKLYHKNMPQKGDKISFSGQLNIDAFLKAYLIKNVRKITKF
ncbi:MAG: Rho termination factor N-terminal domain-containing protein [Promethearchaeota archaeon]